MRRALVSRLKTLIPATGIDALFKYLQDAHKGTVVGVQLSICWITVVYVCYG